ncbi:MAG TPA: HlyD family efflux transporter periplasmic adaptor subunit, partial [Desulfatiglandales bacterium]|nr:HlyD family efflux transporter periplasmic adaptor subunit [Desulfatiglandales bacterium]
MGIDSLRTLNSFKWTKYLVIFLVLAGILYWLRFRPVPVQGFRISKGDIAAEVMGTGTLEARVQTIVSSKISGRISQMLADQGDRVEAGKVLVRLDDSELVQQVEIARSALAAAKATVDRVETDERRTKAVLDKVLRDHERNQKLFANKSISVNEIENSEKAFTVAETDYASARAASLEKKKNLIVAQNTLDYNLARLEDTVIKAPFTGLIVRRDREPGDVVVPGSSIFLLISTQELWIRAWIDETDMAKVSPDQPARIVFRSEPGRPYPGKVVRLGRETDRETRQFVVDVEVTSLPTNWSVGQRAEVYIQSAKKT